MPVISAFLADTWPSWGPGEKLQNTPGQADRSKEGRNKEGRNRNRGGQRKKGSLWTRQRPQGTSKSPPARLGRRFTGDRRGSLQTPPTTREALWRAAQERPRVAIPSPLT